MGKKDLCVWQKRPICMAKEAYSGQRDLFSQACLRYASISVGLVSLDIGLFFHINRSLLTLINRSLLTLIKIYILMQTSTTLTKLSLFPRK
jgi:hypothetical protein